MPAPEYPAFLSPEECRAMDGARLSVSAEVLVNFGGLLQLLGATETEVSTLTGALRSRLGQMTLHGLHRSASDLESFVAPFGNTRQLIDLTDETESVRLVEPEQVPHNANMPAKPVADDSLLIEPLGVAIAHAFGATEPPVSENGPSASQSLEAAGRQSTVERLGEGLNELGIIFRGVLNVEETARLQDFDDQQRELFLQWFKRTYSRYSARPMFADRQADRVALFMQRLSKKEVATKLDEELTTVGQSVKGMANIMSRGPDMVRQGFTEANNLLSKTEESAHDDNPLGTGELVDAEQQTESVTLTTKIATDLVEILELDDTHILPLADLLDPQVISGINGRGMRVVGALRDYIITNYGGLETEILNLTANERSVLRRLTGLYVNQGKSDIREPVNLSQIVLQLAPQLQEIRQAELYSSLTKLIDASDIDLGKAEILSNEKIVQQAVETPEIVTREVWLAAAENITRQLAAILQYYDESANALWRRAHYDTEGEHRLTDASLKNVLETIQKVMVAHSQAFWDDKSVSNSAFKQFVTVAFGGPKDLDQIEQTLSGNGDKQVRMAERHVVYMFQKMLTYMQGDT